MLIPDLGLTLGSSHLIDWDYYRGRYDSALACSLRRIAGSRDSGIVVLEVR